MEAVAEKTVAPLLRTDQVIDLEDEISAMERKLSSPNFQGDRGTVRGQLIAARKQLDTQRPRPFVGPELDTAVARERELREAIRSDGMLSHEEMRKSPPGAVDRHRAWEKRNMPKIEEWQNIQRRLTADSDDREAASIENFRPTASTMNMHGALIEGKTFFLPPSGAATPVMFTDAQIAALKAIAPDVADRLATLTNVERAQVKDTLGGSEVKKRTLSPEHKAAMKAGREAKAKKAA